MLKGSPGSAKAVGSRLPGFRPHLCFNEMAQQPVQGQHLRAAGTDLVAILVAESVGVENTPQLGARIAVCLWEPPPWVLQVGTNGRVHHTEGLARTKECTCLLTIVLQRKQPFVGLANGCTREALMRASTVKVPSCSIL